jgi:hypothetical protein
MHEATEMAAETGMLKERTGLVIITEQEMRTDLTEGIRTETIIMAIITIEIIIPITEDTRIMRRVR